MEKQFPDSTLDIRKITCYPVTVADSRFTREYLLQVPPLIAAEAGHLKTSINVIRIRLTENCNQVNYDADEEKTGSEQVENTASDSPLIKAMTTKNAEE